MWVLNVKAVVNTLLQDLQVLFSGTGSVSGDFFFPLTAFRFPWLVAELLVATLG